MFKRKEKKIKKEFEEIYDNYVEKIFRFAYLKVGTRDDAQDITSKAFVKFWDTLKDDKKELKNPKAFLYQITRNLIIDYYRTNREGGSQGWDKKIPLENIILSDKEMRADEKAFIHSEIEEVKKALKEINEDYQDVIILYYLNELTSSEIADLLEKPENTVRVLIHRSVASLRKAMKKKEV